MTKALAFFLMIVSAMLAQSSAGRAHAGHDHGPSIEVSASVAPRFEAASDDFEALGVLKGSSLVLTLDRFRTNEPILNAKIEATINGETATVTPDDNATYKMTSPTLFKAGRAEILLTISSGAITDLLAGVIEIPGTTASAARATHWWQRLAFNQDSLIAALGGVMFGVLGVLLFRKGAAREHGNTTVEHAKHRIDAKIVRLVVMTVAAGQALAHAQPATAELPPKARITITADLPQRLPDGSLFVPKITQRLLSIRTVLAGESTAGSTIELNGQIIADPNGFGRVQATVDGRIDAPKWRPRRARPEGRTRPSARHPDAHRRNCRSKQLRKRRLAKSTHALRSLKQSLRV